MLNLNRRAVMLLLPLVLLAGCVSRQASLPPAWLPALPALPPSARQESMPAQCSPTCLQRWNQQAEGWRKSLQEAGLAD